PLSIAALVIIGLMAGVFLFGIWSNLGRIAGPEQYAMDFASLLPFGYAFAAGIVASVNPCGFLMLPAYIGYTLKNPSTDLTPVHLLRALILSGAVTLGFLTLFSAIGLVVVTGGNAVTKAFPWAGFAVGIVLAGIGLWLLLTGRTLGLTAASRVSSSGSGLRSTFLYGVAYGIVSLSCSLPVFLVVVGTSLSTRGILPSLGQFACFALGMGFIVTAISLSTLSIKVTLAQTLRAIIPYTHRLSALLLTGAGIYLMVYWIWLGDAFN
ncbi:hypothetical protein M1O29_02400, partial [Dehalococcoidia bacterium]|nr:hypothetical protein [Dehalococcoidia bacterium]